MPGALLNLCFFLLMFYAESVFSVCDVRVHTIDLGCHLEWDCPDANPETTYTVWAKQFGELWSNVSNCTQISRQSCDLSHVFRNPEVQNSIRLRSEESLSKSYPCQPLNDTFAKFSPPSITISADTGNLWVTINFPCAPSVFCMLNSGEESSGEGVTKKKEELEDKCTCSINEFKGLLATVTLYNKQDLSDRQTHTAELMEGDGNPLEVEFGFLRAGREYCIVANFTAEGVLDPSPSSPPLCVSIPAKTERLMVVIVCAVLITLCLMLLLLWKQCPSSERPLPKALALLLDLELQNEFDSSKVAPHIEIADVDYISVESFCDFTLMDDHSFYQNCRGLSNGYYSSAILHIPECTEESEESGGSDVQHDGLLQLPSHLILEEELEHLYQNQCEETLNIPLNSVIVKRVEQEETSAEEPETPHGEVTLND